MISGQKSLRNGVVFSEIFILNNLQFIKNYFPSLPFLPSLHSYDFYLPDTHTSWQRFLNFFGIIVLIFLISCHYTEVYSDPYQTINPFVPNTPFSTPWKQQGIEKVCIGNKWFRMECFVKTVSSFQLSIKKHLKITPLKTQLPMLRYARSPE